jgi:hypothetical protein
LVLVVDSLDSHLAPTQVVLVALSVFVVVVVPSGFAVSTIVVSMVVVSLTGCFVVHTLTPLKMPQVVPSFSTEFEDMHFKPPTAESRPYAQGI